MVSSTIIARPFDSMCECLQSADGWCLRERYFFCDSSLHGNILKLQMQCRISCMCYMASGTFCSSPSLFTTIYWNARHTTTCRTLSVKNSPTPSLQYLALDNLGGDNKGKWKTTDLNWVPSLGATSAVVDGRLVVINASTQLVGQQTLRVRLGAS